LSHFVYNCDRFLPKKRAPLRGARTPISENAGEAVAEKGGKGRRKLRINILSPRPVELMKRRRGGAPHSD
jgi:hypothetical protein